jgi:lipid-A-disaccharide synthase
MLPYPRIFISAGERSGDRFGASLASAIRDIEPDARLFGVGGPQMASAGVRVLADTVGHAGMGLRYVFANLDDWLKVFRRCIRQFNGEPPDILVPIDNPGFNLRLAGHARERNIPVCYYVSPQVWAWLPHRIHRIGRLVTRMMAILPFEKPLYDRIGVDCRYVGHPLLDYLASARIDEDTKQSFLKECGASERTAVGLLPGSRLQEIRHSFPLICDAAVEVRRARPDSTFLVAASAPEHIPEIAAVLGSRRLPARILIGKTAEIMQASRVCLVVSGTAALETAYFRTPMVVVYRAGSWARHVAPRMLNVKHISLVNILAGRGVVPEFLKFDDNASGIGEAALRLLTDESAWSECRANLDEVVRSLGPAGTSHRAAEAVLDCLNLAHHC